MTERLSLAPYLAEVERIPALRWTGQVTQVVGLLVERWGGIGIEIVRRLADALRRQR